VVATLSRRQSFQAEPVELIHIVIQRIDVVSTAFALEETLDIMVGSARSQLRSNSSTTTRGTNYSTLC
jgi:hypothetical protein